MNGFHFVLNIVPGDVARVKWRLAEGRIKKERQREERGDGEAGSEAGREAGREVEREAGRLGEGIMVGRLEGLGQGGS